MAEKKKTLSNDLDDLKLLKQIIRKYTEELTGRFIIFRARITQNLLRVFLRSVFRNMWVSMFDFRQYQSTDHEKWLNLYGDLDKIKLLDRDHTLVFLPTHQSSLDPAILAFCINDYLKMPAFWNASNLRLYNYPFLRYLLKGIGIYPIDKRKRNIIYYNSLMSIPVISILWGINNLIYPSGNLSNSGLIAHKYKKGLIKSIVEAYTIRQQRRDKSDIIIVPIVMNYDSFPEASMNTRRYLADKNAGDGNMPTSIMPYIQYILRNSNVKSQVHISFGEVIPVSNVLGTESTINVRNATKVLLDKIIQHTRMANIVIPSHLIAFATFSLLQEEFQTLSLHQLLNLPTNLLELPSERLLDKIEQLKSRLIQLHRSGHIKLTEEIFAEPIMILNKGISELGKFHSIRPIRKTKNGHIRCDDMPLLYFYYNRLSANNLLNDQP